MDLQQVAETDFVLLHAAWPVEKGQRLVETLRPTHVIVHRRDAAECYYLFTTQEALRLFAQSQSAPSIREALNLHESGATPVLEGTTSAENAPDRCIVCAEGRLVGFFDATTLPPPHMTRGQGKGVQSAQPVARSLLAEIPETVPLHETVSLLVFLSAALADGIGLSITLPVGTAVDVIVQARRGFVLEGRVEGSFVISDAQETLPLQFKLRATALGPGQIRVLALHNGVALGALTLTPTVVEALPQAAPGLAAVHEQPLAPVSVRLPDLSLLIEETRLNGSRAFVMRVTAANPGLNLNLTKFGPIPFQTDPGLYFEEFYKDIETYPLQTPTDRAVAARRLANKGAFLFSTLIPPDVRKKLWSLRDQIKSVLIQSEEPWIPWELCKLCGKENGQVVEGPFLCEAFATTRWIPGLGLKPALTLKNLALVVPSDSGLPCAQDELSYLLSLAGGTRHVTRVPARFVELSDALTSGQYDGWHFTGHGGYRNPDPNRSAMYLENQDPFSPGDVVGAVANLGMARPLVFLNACQIGRSGMSLTDIGGWARQFLTAGAGAFIGAYWSVYDQPACDFAKECYNRLLAGVPIGRAVQGARLAIKPGGDSTWLAYTVFADPWATVQ
jgi:hypothetical protein